jgi:hypothetical protein
MLGEQASLPVAYTLHAYAGICGQRQSRSKTKTCFHDNNHLLVDRRAWWGMGDCFIWMRNGEPRFGGRNKFSINGKKTSIARTVHASTRKT